jgi:hypothetical protein
MGRQVELQRRFDIIIYINTFPCRNVPKALIDFYLFICFSFFYFSWQTICRVIGLFFKILYHLTYTFGSTMKDRRPFERLTAIHLIIIFFKPLSLTSSLIR